MTWSAVPERPGRRKRGRGELVGFSDADWDGSPDDRRSTSWNAFMINGAATSWARKKQGMVALSTTEAEYVAMSAAAQEAVWLRRLVGDLGAAIDAATAVMEQNQGAIALPMNPVSHGHSKHIDIRHRYIREVIDNEVVAQQYSHTKEMIEDMLTKPLGKGPFESARRSRHQEGCPSRLRKPAARRSRESVEYD